MKKLIVTMVTAGMMISGAVADTLSGEVQKMNDRCVGLTYSLDGYSFECKGVAIKDKMLEISVDINTGGMIKELLEMGHTMHAKKLLEEGATEEQKKQIWCVDATDKTIKLMKFTGQNGLGITTNATWIYSGVPIANVKSTIPKHFCKYANNKDTDTLARVNTYNAYAQRAITYKQADTAFSGIAQVKGGF